MTKEPIKYRLCYGVGLACFSLQFNQITLNTLSTLEINFYSSVVLWLGSPGIESCQIRIYDPVCFATVCQTGFVVQARLLIFI